MEDQIITFRKFLKDHENKNKESKEFTHTSMVNLLQNIT